MKDIDIVRVDKLDKEEFDEKYLENGIPVIIENALEDWKPLKWNLDYLCSKIGSNRVTCRGKTNEESYRLGQRYTMRECTFQSYVDDLLAGNKRSKSSYLAVQNFKQAFPEIADEVTLPEYVGKIHCGPYLWVARKGHYEYVHVDPDDNFLIMISGEKKLRLYGCEVEPLYPAPLGSEGKTIQSQVDVENPDFDKFEKFKDVTCYNCTLKPGEMLFIPGFWWHQVTSTEMSISINMFFGDAGKDVYLEKLMSDARWPALSYWFLNIIEQNRNHESFQRILARLPDVIRAFVLNKWHEVPKQCLVDRIVKLIMDYLQIEELPTDTKQSKFPPVLKIRGLTSRDNRK